MPLFRRPGKGGHHDEDDLPEIDPDVTARAQEVMKDHLGIMRDVVMKIRHQDGYAKAMYANCPRLQHLLDKNPDLRPVFEDPRLVRINFETVYKEAGGILPEDEEEAERKKNNPSLIMRIANHPIFKILKVLIFVKKFIGCIAGGGIALVGSIWACATDCCTDCCCEDDVQEVGEVDEYYEENEYGLEDMPMDENQRALNSAADYMEDPEVQEQMQRLLDDPEHLEDAIENDTELRTLRDSNPLCAELMQDPETMKILTDPDNLRALGEAPQMIELDFNDPHGFQPQSDFVDVEMGEVELEESLDVMEASGDVDGLEETYEEDYGDNQDYFPMEDDTPGVDQEIGETWDDEGLATADEIEMTEVAETEAAPVEQEAATSNWEDDFELEQQEMDAADTDAANKGKTNNAKKNGNNKKQQKNHGGIKGVITAFGVAATDVIAAQIVGEVFGSDLMPGDLMGGGGGDIDLGGMDAVADNADALVNDDVAALAEDTADGIDDEKDAAKADAAGGRRGIGIGSGAAATGVAGATLARGRSRGNEDEDSSLDDGLESIGEESEAFDDDGDSSLEEDTKKTNKIFGAFKNLASATVAAAKEQVATTLLGDDLGEMLIEKAEEAGEEDEEEEEDGKKKKKKRFRLFGKNKKEPEMDVAVIEDEELISEHYDYSSSANTDDLYNSASLHNSGGIPVPEHQFNASIPIPEEDSSQYSSSSSYDATPKLRVEDSTRSARFLS